MTQISEHFSLTELTFSSTAARLMIPNDPPDEAIEELERLCAVILEPTRALLDVPMHTDSGYRCPAVNAAVGGAADSAHLFGRAADEIPIGMDLRAAFDKIRGSAIPFDQLIIEAGIWLHLATAPFGQAPRREALIGIRTLGRDGKPKWRYEPVG